MSWASSTNITPGLPGADGTSRRHFSMRSVKSTRPLRCFQSSHSAANNWIRLGICSIGIILARSIWYSANSWSPCMSPLRGSRLSPSMRSPRSVVPRLMWYLLSFWSSFHSAMCSRLSAMLGLPSAW